MGIYKSPTLKEIDFIADMEDYLNQVDPRNNVEQIIIGDLNIDILDNTSRISTGYLDMLAINGFVPLINKPTRVTHTTSTCIDHCFIKTNKAIDSILSGIIVSGITDHYPIIMTTQSDGNSGTKNGPNSKESLNLKKFRNIISNVDWTEFYGLGNGDQCAETLHEIINNAKLQSTTMKITSKKNKNPWITPGIIRSIKYRDKLHKAAMKSKNQIIQDQYKKYRNLLNTIMKKARYSFYKRQIEKTQDQKDIWNMINSFMLNRKTRKKSQNTKLLKPDGSRTSTDHETANVFNDYFVNVGKNLARQIKYKNYDYSSMNRVMNSFLLHPVTSQEIYQEIMILKDQKAPGFDQFTSPLIKSVADLIAEPLTHTINVCFRTAKFPRIYKKAVITTIYKSGKKELVNNHRPISVISKFGKIMEKTIYKRLVQFLNEHNVINNKQYGFRQHISTEDALAQFINSIYEKMDKSKPVAAIFIDLAKAFDTLDHNHLLKKLEYQGIRGLPHELMKDYLSSREQTVKIGDSQSDVQIMTYGVPQGTVLGPLLFILYMNDLFECKIRGQITAFADDTSIVFSGRSWTEVIENMEVGISIVQEWFSNNSLTVNIQKTNFILFGSHIDATPSIQELTFTHAGGEETLKRTNCTKYLGVMIDGHLRWDEHLKWLNNKLRYLPLTLGKLRNIIGTKILANTIYHALFLSILRYGIITWGGCNTTHISGIEILQKAALKKIYDKPRTYPSKLLFQETQQLTIRQLYILRISLYLAKLGELYEQRITGRVTRAATNLQIKNPKMSKTVGQQNFKYIGSKVINLMPTNLRRKLLLFENKYNVTIKNEIIFWLRNTDIEQVNDLLF